MSSQISIHALLAESDVNDAINGCNPDIISIHALLAESDGKSNKFAGLKLVFLSTLSLRRATRRTYRQGEKQAFLSTLSLRRATAHYDNYNLHCVISIHALLAESDYQILDDMSGATSHFYPRSPCGERPAELTTLVNKLFISIHALLAESDGKSTKLAGWKLVFLSTLSLRRATTLI